jgi:hypothetical protein
MMKIKNNVRPIDRVLAKVRNFVDYAYKKGVIKTPPKIMITHFLQKKLNSEI